MDQKSILAKNIKRIRDIKSLSQAGLAEKADISIMAISRIETGNRWPRKDTLKAIAKVLEVTVDDLLSSEKINPKIDVHNPTLADAVVILEKIRSLEPLYRSMALAFLFEDKTLVLPHAPKSLRNRVNTFAQSL